MGQKWELCSDEEGCLDRWYELPVTKNIGTESIQEYSVLRGKPNKMLFDAPFSDPEAF